MNTLLIFDSHINLKSSPFEHLKRGKQVLLCPLTSREDIIQSVLRNCEEGHITTEILPMADLVNKTAEEIRPHYLRFIAELPDILRKEGHDLHEIFRIRGNVSLWWFSLIAEKNTFKTRAFNDLVQWSSMLRVIEERNIEQVIWAAGNKRLFTALRQSGDKTVKTSRWPIYQERSWKKRIKDGQQGLWLKHVFILLWNMLHSWRVTRLLKRSLRNSCRPPLSERTMILFTHFPFFDQKAAEEGKYQNGFYRQAGLSDNNIGFLAMLSQSQDYDLSTTLRYAGIFSQGGQPLYFLYEMCTGKMILCALALSLKMGWRFILRQRALRRAHAWDGRNFYTLFRDDWYASFVGKVGFFGILDFMMFEKALGQIRAASGLYFLENHAWERSLVLARNEIRHPMRLYGYQHATVSPFLLNYFQDPKELEDHQKHPFPRPDKLLCNGRIAHGYFRESGWDESDLVDVEAFRYRNLPEALKQLPGSRDRSVLLVLSISPEESRALIHSVGFALEGQTDILVRVKPHPFMKRGELESMIEQSRIGMEIVAGPIENWLVKSPVVVVGESGVSMEALAFGCRIVIAEVPEWINMSPLRNVKSPLVQSTTARQALKEAILNGIEQVDTDDTKMERKRILNDFFHLPFNGQSHYLRLNEALEGKEVYA